MILWALLARSRSWDSISISICAIFCEQPLLYLTYSNVSISSSLLLSPTFASRDWWYSPIYSSYSIGSWAGFPSQWPPWLLSSIWSHSFQHFLVGGHTYLGLPQLSFFIFLLGFHWPTMATIWTSSTSRSLPGLSAPPNGQLWSPLHTLSPIHPVATWCCPQVASGCFYALPVLQNFGLSRWALRISVCGPPCQPLASPGDIWLPWWSPGCPFPSSTASLPICSTLSSPPPGCGNTSPQSEPLYPKRSVHSVTLCCMPSPDLLLLSLVYRRRHGSLSPCAGAVGM